MSIVNKKLTRIPSQGKIAGVCAGLAQYFEVDVAIVRILMLIALVCGCSLGLWIYLICWICMPSE